MSDRPVASGGMGLPTWVAAAFIDSRLTPLIILASILLGAGSLGLLPREEEPQISVPVIDLMVEMPGAASREIEQRVARPLENLLQEIPGVEYVYSTSRPGQCLVVVRFEVGHDENDALVKTNAKLAGSQTPLPTGARLPRVRVRTIDDVPILTLTFWSDVLDHGELRRVAAGVAQAVREVDQVSETRLIGGLPRTLRVVPDPVRLGGSGLTPRDLVRALGTANRKEGTGPVTGPDAGGGELRESLVETGRFLETADDVEDVVVGVHEGATVQVRDVARVIDGPDEPDQYVFHLPGGRERAPGRSGDTFRAAVTLTVSKRRGANAVDVAREVLAKVEGLEGRALPGDVHRTVTRHYGRTAAEKSDELLHHMGLAVLSVCLLISFFLGLRESLVVAVAIPVTLALTMTGFHFLGFTLNRITLFALIFSIGILVDDPIVDVENIVRHARMPGNRGRPMTAVTLEAVSEVRSPLILATLAVIAAILPMAFVRGLMGPYMRPIPIGASMAMTFSMLVAFVITPWAAARMLAGHDHSTGEGDGKEGRATLWYRRIMGTIIESRWLSWGVLLGMALLLLLALSTLPTGKVQVKMLPFDDKSELQVIIDLPEGVTLEHTVSVARELASAVTRTPEVTDVQVYAGTAAPFNFNGLIRHYDLRQGSNVADLQVNFEPRRDRDRQSHMIAREIRARLSPLASRHQARVKVAEVPPGPPVLQTLVAEVYGPDRDHRETLARRIEGIFRRTPGVVDVDTSMEDPQRRFLLEVDGAKAALAGTDETAVAEEVSTCLAGRTTGLLHAPGELEEVRIQVRLDRADRSVPDCLDRIPVRVRSATVAPARELLRVKEVPADGSLHHKNLQPVTYVLADVAGEAESPAYALLAMKDEIARLPANPEPSTGLDVFYSRLPRDPLRYSMKWDGEIQITYEVFRDLGAAFLLVLILIYVLVVGWFESFTTPFVIMAAIPFSLVGILPAHWLAGAYFSATSMIGFIAGAGIVVRNSIILVDFIELRERQGMSREEAVVDAGAVRFRPMVLTAAAVVVGSSVILFDPIFQGLAISLMAGEIASLLLSRMAVPILYHRVLGSGRTPPRIRE